MYSKYQLPTYPSAEASKVWHRPDGESMPARANDPNSLLSNSSFTPATSATSHFSSLRADDAASKATNDDEHAVSYTAFGPWKLKTYEIRPDAMDADVPVAPYTEFSTIDSDADDDVAVPTKTPQFNPFT